MTVRYRQFREHLLPTKYFDNSCFTRVLAFSDDADMKHDIKLYKLHTKIWSARQTGVR